MKISTVFTTLLAGASLVSASNCRPSPPSSVSSSSSAAASPSPSIVTGPGGCTFDPNINLVAGQLDATTSNWYLNSGTQYGCLYNITTCNNGPTNDCIVYYFDPVAFGETTYDVEFSFYLGSTVAGSTYNFQFDVSTSDNLSTPLSVGTGNTFAETDVALNTANTVQTVTLTVDAVADTNFIINASPVDPSTILTFNNFAIYQTACGQGSSD